ncbi:MAG: peptide deformylase [Betaproteobacteria bacterium TMED41]|nr:MAG: peptide deformylase [Betaproteobacteria bacterium TMED41]
MAILKILKFPDERLRIKATPVVDFDFDLKKLANDMADTMYNAPGIGLAATQVNIHKRIIVVDITSEKKDLKVLVNPYLTNKSTNQKVHEEGCLSVPGIFEEVKRPDLVEIAYQDLDGKTCRLSADGLLSVCIQHEMDHLLGKVFVDYLSRLKQSRIRKKINKGKHSNSKELNLELSEPLN